MSKLNRYGKRIGSQNGEAGIILYILDQIGSGNKQLVEIGHDEICNSANLLSNYGWYGWMIDSWEVNRIKALVRWTNCKPITAFLTMETVNKVLTENGVPPEIDMLSLDVDGNDYWLWKEMEVNTRLAVIEYNATFGDEESITIEYHPDFDRKNYAPFYHGASLQAMTKLAKEKGMSLVGCEGSGINAFFVKDECLTEELVAVTPKEAYYPHRSRVNWVFALEKMREQRYELIKV